MLFKIAIMLPLITRKVQKGYIYALVIHHFITTIIGQLTYEMEIPMNNIHMYSSCELTIFEFRAVEWGGSVITDA